MKNINNFYKDEFEKIDISNEKRDEINNQIKNKYMLSQRRKKTIICLSSIFLVFIVSISIVYADEIKEFINTFKIIVTTDKDGNKVTEARSEDYRKELNYDADFPEINSIDNKNGSQYSIKQLEEGLNIKILKSDLIKNDKVKIRLLTKEKGKISSGHFFLKDILNDYERRIDVNISFVTKYYPDNSYTGWKSSDSLKSTKYYIKNLNADAYILTFNGDANAIGHYDILLIYDNISYRFNATIIDYDYEKQKQFVEDFLNSLSY